MRARAILLAAGALALFPASAAADYPHVVAPGETLTSVAATDGLTIAAIAQANGISTDTELVAGQILLIPPRSYTTAAVSTDIAATSTTSTSGDPATATATATSPTTAESETTQSETTTTAQTSSTPKSTASTTGTATYGSPQPTAEYVSSSEIANVAESEGVPAALAQAIAWEESGFNNDEVSSVDAVGVMQIVPTTWDWIDAYLTPANPLGTTDALENVRGGVLLLHQLLQQTGGDEQLAVAGYYQGLASVRDYGMYADTQRYAADVMALAQRFGG